MSTTARLCTHYHPPVPHSIATTAPLQSRTSHAAFHRVKDGREAGKQVFVHEHGAGIGMGDGGTLPMA